MKKLLFIFILILLSSNAFASLKNKIKTSSACYTLKTLGLQAAKDWHYYGDYIGWGCNSNYKEIRKNAGQYYAAVNLSFYAEGLKNEVKKVYLSLNVNNKIDAKFGHEKLLESSSILYSKISGRSLTSDIVKAIINGKPFQKKLNDLDIQVTRDDWPTGKGYGVSFIIN